MARSIFSLFAEDERFRRIWLAHQDGRSNGRNDVDRRARSDLRQSPRTGVGEGRTKRRGGSAVSEVIGRQVLFKKPAPFTIACENFPAFLRFSETFPAPGPPTPAGLFASQASNHGTKENTTARAMRYFFKPSVRALSPFQLVTRRRAMTVVLHRFPEVRRIRASILRTRIAKIDYAHILYVLWPGRNSATAHRKPSRKGKQQKSRRQQHLRKSLTGQIQGESQQTKPPCFAPIGNGQIRRRARYDRRRTVLHISPDVFPIPVKLFFYRPR
jgi:hypothetical protein